MKTVALVETSLVNGLGGDPAVYAFFPRSGDAVLFDLGDLSNLSNRDLLKVRTALVSHTHIDHFIGFDRLLRVNIPHFRELELVGPPGLIVQVQGKLTGYLWNLLEPDQLRFIVHEVHPDGRLTSARIENQTGFKPQPYTPPEPTLNRLDRPLPQRPAVCATVLADGTRIEAIALDHGTPSIAYACQSPCRIKVKDDALQALGEAPGPWIRDLQIAVSNRELSQKFTVGGKVRSTEELANLLFEISHPRPIGYLTDLGFTPDNLARTKALFADTETLICETNYRDSEHQKARERMHLTTRQAALLAAHAGAKELKIFHISNVYATTPELSVMEAQTFFTEFVAMPPQALMRAIETELKRI